MKKLVLIALASILLMGCENTREALMEQRNENVFQYLCRGVPLTVMVDQPLSRVHLLIDGQTRVLPQVMAASGAKYSDGTYVFWSKADRAIVAKSNIIILDDCELQ